MVMHHCAKFGNTRSSYSEDIIWKKINWNPNRCDLGLEHSNPMMDIISQDTPDYDDHAPH